MSAEVAIVEVVFVRKFQMAGDFTARFSYCSSCHVSNVSFLLAKIQPQTMTEPALCFTDVQLERG